MPKIATIKTLHSRYYRQLKAPTHVGQLREVVAIAAKRGIAVAPDGRCYIPESKRGKGVGYGKHG